MGLIHGYSSLPAMWRMARRIAYRGKHAYILRVGDRDPDGLGIWRDVRAEVRQYAPGADVTFLDLALTVEQIAKYGIEYRSTKRTSNADMTGSEAEYSSAEVDALEPNVLRQLVEDEITRDDEDDIAEVKEAEEAEIERLREGGRRVRRRGLEPGIKFGGGLPPTGPRERPKQ
jgi:hypothetical protein